MYFFYSLILLIIFPLVFLRLFLVGKYRHRWRERLGNVPPEVKRESEKGNCIWLHAVSVGEVMAASPFISLLHRKFPHYPLILSTVTPTGRETAEKVIRETRSFFYFPYDFPWVVGKVLWELKPRIFIFWETELWPNFLKKTEEMGIPSLLLNGRISSSSFFRYCRWRNFTRRVLSCISAFGMQTEEDARRIISLGAPPERIQVTGNTKFDRFTSREKEKDRSRWMKELGVLEGEKVLVAGSTHRGEEGKVIEGFKAVREKFPHALLILAPRHPERVGEIESILREKGLNWVKRSEADNKREREVIILDTLGELSHIYSLADVVFVGGSLIPRGGHNVIEPASLGKPVLFGPHMDNFEESARLLLQGGGGLQVKDGEDLKRGFMKLLSDPLKREEMGKLALKTVQAHRGASLRSLLLVEKFLDEGGE